MSQIRKLFLSVLLAILMLSFCVSMCGAFTFGGSFNYQTSSGGIVHFGRDITVSQWSQQGALTRFSGVVWNGNFRGVLMVDAPAGTTVNFTSLQQTVMIYQVSDAGAGTQTINYQGLGRPTEVTGGTFVMDGDEVVVTTAGSVLVTISWHPEVLALTGQLMTLLVTFTLIPLMLGAYGVQGVMNGSIDSDEFSKLIFGVVSVIVILFTLALVIKNLGGI